MKKKSVKPSHLLSLALKAQVKKKFRFNRGSWFSVSGEKKKVCMGCAIGSLAYSLGLREGIGKGALERYLGEHLPVLFRDISDYKIRYLQSAFLDDFDGEDSVGNAINHRFERGDSVTKLIKFLKSKGL